MNFSALALHNKRKGKKAKTLEAWRHMVSQAGFEPATFPLGGGR